MELLKPSPLTQHRPTGGHLMMRRQHHRPGSSSRPPNCPSPSCRRTATTRLFQSAGMSSIATMASRRAFARQSLLRAPPRRFYSASKMEEADLEKGPKRDPELYVLLGVMSGAFLIAGWYFGRKPTSVNSESNVRVGKGAMPWHADEEDGKVYKYQYHPHGDTSQPLRNAPSAMNTVIVPKVTLPEDLHERFNKYGKEEWDY